MKKKISSDSKKPKVLESFFNVNKNDNKNDTSITDTSN